MYRHEWHPSEEERISPLGAGLIGASLGYLGSELFDHNVGGGYGYTPGMTGFSPYSFGGYGFPSTSYGAFNPGGGFNQPMGYGFPGQGLTGYTPYGGFPRPQSGFGYPGYGVPGYGLPDSSFGIGQSNIFGLR
ncbi:hypothetical protein [Halalkalibacter urbisdiaboli]|uniref:hypothetical protein n=1 Tax=Halalkalibacter urbisdiaboli TaxID=1960589 RepID=UPI001FDA3D19|nr:hypothetical protein [Halalkalibacter urbisdiaboli]